MDSTIGAALIVGACTLAAAAMALAGSVIEHRRERNDSEWIRTQVADLSGLVEQLGRHVADLGPPPRASADEPGK